ncbi:MAG: hypothetical protein K2X03_30240 [Bryobacteraceae bacterium]|nr:hypothetical protein [Bryobacteraceae bacterium]
MRGLLSLCVFAPLACAQSYVRDVYPIWEKHCLGCHTAGTKMGSLDIETWEGLQRGGNHGTILVPGDLKASRLYTMLIGEGQPAMPMDGQVLSAAEIAVVRDWIAAGAPPPSGAEIAMLRRRAAGEDILSCAVGPTEVAFGHVEGIELIDLVSGKRSRTLPIVGARRLAFSPDGQRLVTANEKETVVWSLKTLAPEAKFGPMRAIIFAREGLLVADRAQAVASAPSGQRFAGAEGKVIRLRSDGRLLSASAPQAGEVVAMAWSPDGRWLAAATGERLSILDGDSLEERKNVPARAAGVGFSRDSTRIATCQIDGSFGWIER